MPYIKKLVMHGFKSFVRKTELPFEREINIILGPNGSGKSNITDALCFVLGRLSIKSMRAAKAKNLIFLGTKNIAPSKEAVVEIIFDNTDWGNSWIMSTTNNPCSRGGEVGQNINHLYCIQVWSDFLGYYFEGIGIQRQRISDGGIIQPIEIIKLNLEFDIPDWSDTSDAGELKGAPAKKFNNITLFDYGLEYKILD